MAKFRITAITVETVTEKTGFMGRKTVEDEILRLEMPRGSVRLRKSTVEGAGDNWLRLKRRLKEEAREKHIPFADETE